ncbi:hypothetical protein FRC11_010236 [Ceratobasidium sp. 423]|nr:hypothetical protein FRC11_010236 [Ceratobasidium sp. 423]
MTYILDIKKRLKEVPQHPGANQLDDTTRNNIMDSVITTTYAMIQQHAATDDYAVRVLVVANNWLNKKIWTRCLAVCVGPELGEEVNSTSMLAQLTTVQIQISVFKFIEDIQRRIRAHALEIEALGLATATVVQSDIEETMSEIWKSLPCGFLRQSSPTKDATDASTSLNSPDPIGPENAV